MDTLTPREIKNAKQREYRAKNKNVCTSRYEKTRNGFLMRAYRNMLSRVSGVQKEKHHLYSGLNVLDKEFFYEWSKRNEDFVYLFDQWEKSGYDRRLTPSVDRIDSSMGYDVPNMRWITHSENSRLGAISRHHGGKK